MEYAIKVNEQFNSLEIEFNGKPSEAVREALKKLKFRWHSLKKVWYGYGDKNAIETLLKDSLNKPTEKVIKAEIKPKEEPRNHTLKVGDLLIGQFGYEETLTVAFQIVSLNGKDFVRVREVMPVITSEKNHTGMSCDRTYKVTNKPLTPVEKSLFIKDQEKGDLKKVKTYGGEPLITITSYMSAYKYDGGTLYESWYY